jgi:hypothetical protein
MKPDIFRQYPLVKKYFDQMEDMGGSLTPGARILQERAIELIHAEGGGTKEEKEASMICAAVILDPPSLYMDIGRFWDGYSEEVGNVINGLISTAPDSFLPVPLAQGTLAAGIATMEGVEKSVQTGKPPLTGTLQETLDGVKKAYGQEMEIFAYLEAPALMSRYEKTRETLFAQLETKIQPVPQIRRPPKPGNGSFDF